MCDTSTAKATWGGSQPYSCLASWAFSQTSARPKQKGRATCLITGVDGVEFTITTSMGVGRSCITASRFCCK